MSELMKAVSQRDEKKINELLSKKGIKLDEADAHGNTPLNYACAMGINEEIILKMIQMGASCKIPNKNGAMPLNHAVYSRLSQNILKAIVEAGGDVNYQNESGGTALQVACVCKAGLPTIQCLVDDLKADPDLPNNNGNTPLMFAIRNKNEYEVVKFLAEKSKDINAQTTKDESKYPGFTALHFAAGEHLPAHAATLITIGAKTDLTNGEGYTPLQLADEKTKTAMMSSSFAKFSVGDSPGSSPPAQAANRRSTMQGDEVGNRASAKVRAGPLRRTSMLASLSSGSTPSATTPTEPAIHEDDDLAE